MNNSGGKFGFWTGWFVVVASMVGSGILTNSGPIVKISGSYPALFLLWFIGGVLSLCGALTLAELGSTILRPGGDYAYVEEAFGKSVGFVFGWAMVVLGFAAPIALVAYTAASFIGGGLASLGLGVGAAKQFPYLLGTLLIVLFTALHSVGHRESAWVQSFTTIFKIGTLLGFSVLALFAGTGGAPYFAADQGLALTAVPFTALASGLVLVMYAYTGWNGAIYLAAEMKDVKRDMPRTLVWGTVAVTALYLLMNVVYVRAFGAAEMAALSDSDMGRLAEIAVTRLLGAGVGRVFGAAVVLGVLASLSAYILTGPRIVHAMALDGLCPKAFGKLHPQSGVPLFATIAQGVMALLLLWSGTFGEILDFTSYGLACLSGLIILPIFVLRGRPGYEPVFKVPFYPFTPLLFAVVTAAQLIGAAVQTPRTAFLSLGSILLGYPLYRLWRYAAPNA